MKTTQSAWFIVTVVTALRSSSSTSHVDAFVTTTTTSTTITGTPTLSRSSTSWRLLYHYLSGEKNDGSNQSSNRPAFTVPPSRPMPTNSAPGPSLSFTPSSPSTSSTRDEFLQWEAEIQESSLRGVDLLRIQEWLESDDNSNSKDGKSNLDLITQRDNGWKVALASGTVVGLACDYVTHSITLSVLTFGAVVWVALKDPIDDGDGLVGPLARILGRTTLDSYQKVKPKLKALARAAIQNEDVIVKLSSQVKELQRENQALRLYQQRREWIDANQSKYNLEDLKILAQRTQQQQQQTYPTSRPQAYSTLSKQQLMMLLVEIGALRITNGS